MRSSTRTTDSYSRNGANTSAPTAADAELETQARRLAVPAPWFVSVGALTALTGGALALFTGGWAWAVGLVLLALSGPPLVVGAALLLSSMVAHWSARHRPFA